MCVREGKYSRNEYIFNFAVVIDEEIVDWAAYSQVVRKLGRLLRGLEEQGGFLSREEEGVVEDDPGCGIGVAGPESLTGLGSKVYALCEVVLEDLNNYAECMIPIGRPRTSQHGGGQMLTHTRRLQHHKPQTLSRDRTTSTNPFLPSPLTYNIPLLPQ